MNIDELSGNKVEITKEKEKEVIENLDNIALKIKAENRLEELDKKSKELINILEQFSKKVPPMINRLDIINEGLKLEIMQNTITSIKNNSDSILRLGNQIIEYNKTVIQNNQNLYEKQMKTLGETIKKNLNKREYFYYLLDKTLLIVFVGLIFLNIWTIYSYNKKVNIVTNEISRIHNILVNNEKYWINENDYKVFTKYKESKK